MLVIGNNLNVLLIFSALCLAIFTYIVYHVHKQMEKDDVEIHRLAQLEHSEKNKKN